MAAAQSTTKGPAWVAQAPTARAPAHAECSVRRRLRANKRSSRPAAPAALAWGRGLLRKGGGPVCGLLHTQFFKRSDRVSDQSRARAAMRRARRRTDQGAAKGAARGVEGVSHPPFHTPGPPGGRGVPVWNNAAVSAGCCQQAAACGGCSRLPHAIGR